MKVDDDIRHARPSMLYPMHALGEDIHIGAWPLTPDLGTDQTFWEASETILVKFSY